MFVGQTAPKCAAKQARWKTRGRGVGSRGVKNTGFGRKRGFRWIENAGSGEKRGLWWKTRDLVEKTGTK